MLAQAQEVSFPPSVFVPLAVGFFGLGTGYGVPEICQKRRYT